MAIRQQPITTEQGFMDAIKQANENETTIFVQWKYVNNDIYEPEVVTAENFIQYQTNPNDAWWYIENSEARGWILFPNKEERNLPWGEIKNDLV